MRASLLEILRSIPTIVARKASGSIWPRCCFTPFSAMVAGAKRRRQLPIRFVGALIAHAPTLAPRKQWAEIVVADKLRTRTRAGAR
jgi:hypothetical protein